MNMSTFSLYSKNNSDGYEEKKEKDITIIYRLLTGVTLLQAESLREDGVGVLLLFALACSTKSANIA